MFDKGIRKYLKELMLIKQDNQECDICHYWYFLNKGIKFQPYAICMYAIDAFILIVLWYVLLYLLIMSSNLSIYTFFWYWNHILEILFFKILINPSAPTDFPWINLYIIILQPWFHWSTVKFTSFIYPCFVWFTSRLI